MDKGPFRVQRPETSGRVSEPPVVQRSEAVAAHENQGANRAQRRQSTVPKKKPVKLIVFGVLAFVIAAALWYVLVVRAGSLASTIDSGKYQAVFLSNGQIYFGKLKVHNGEYLKLTDIFYLQSQDAENQTDELQAGANQEGELQLIKLGNEVHGPEDQMMISQDQVLFYENLKADSKVATSIKTYQSKN